MEHEVSVLFPQEPATCLHPEQGHFNPCPSWRPISILPFQLHSHVSPPQSCMHLSSPKTCYMLHHSYYSWFYHPNYSWWWEHIIKLLFIYSSPLPRYLVPVRPKYIPQRSILGHPQPMFVSQYDRASFTHVQSNIQNLYFCIFWRLDSSVFNLCKQDCNVCAILICYH